MKDKRRNNVVSLKRRMELKAVFQTIKSGLVYQAIMDDADSMMPQDDKDYFGLVYSIPGEDRSDLLQPVEMEQNQAFMMIDVEEDGDLYPRGGRGVERYEIHDMVTDDVHVMYRVPYRTPNLKAVTKKPKPRQE